MTAISQDREVSPLYVKTLRQYENEENDDDAIRKNGGRYKVLQKLITSLPSEEGCESDQAEIESCLEQFVGADGSVLWQRVVVRSGPSSPRAITHASYMLPKDASSFSMHSEKPSVLCWTTFPDRPNHPLLCVLAHPTLLCIWDVYPSSGIKSIGGAEELEGGEGHNIPLPFEACAIYGVQNGEHGLLLQRSESTEDILAYNNLNRNPGDDNHQDDDGFILKAPPRPKRLRDSLGAGSTLASLNISTATTPTMMGGGGEATSPSASSLIPSLFSLHHPQGDILPVSCTSGGDSQQAAFADVFEKILYTGVVKWVDEHQTMRERAQKSQPICVTYNSQLRRHAVWEIQKTPPPPAQAPLWQVSRQWRSKNGWDSHLGVLQQDLEDFELVDAATDLSRYDTSSRNDALADALGVRRSTPRNSAAATTGTETKSSRTSGVGLGNRNKANVSLLSPSNESHHTLEVNTGVPDQGSMPFTRMGPFTSLHPKTTMACIFVDSNPMPQADNIFLASNTSGSGTLSLCLVSSSEPTMGNPNKLSVFSLKPVQKESTEQPNLQSPYDSRQKFTVQSEGTVPCVTAQPIEASPIPKNYEPHRTNRDNLWTGMATDILLLRNTSPQKSKLSLYRNTHHVVDCMISNDLEASQLKITNVENSCKNLTDIAYIDSDTGNYHSLRGRLSLILHSDFYGEALIQTVEAALENIQDLDVIALKTRADCVRLEHSWNEKQVVEGEIAKTVLLSLLRFDVLGEDVNNAQKKQSETTEKSNWEILLECSRQESYAAEYGDLFDEAPSMIDNARSLDTSNTLSRSVDLSDLCSLAIEHLKSSEVCITTNVFDALHLFYEEMKLYSCKQDGGLRYIGSILCDICTMTSLDGSISNVLSEIFLSYYALDLDTHQRLPPVSTEINKVSGESKESDDFKLSSFAKPPSIFAWIEDAISGNPMSLLFSDFNRTDLNTTCTRIQSFLRIFPKLCDRNDDPSTGLSRDFEVLKILLDEGFSDPEALRDGLPAGVALPLLDLLHRCRASNLGSVGNVDPAIWSLIGRDDTCKKMSDSVTQETNPSANTDLSGSTEDSGKDGIAQLESASSMLFADDNRIREAGRLLRSSKPSFLKVPRAIEVSDHDYERQKQERLLLLSRRVLALPLGRGMLTIGNLKPVPAEPLPLPEICLSGRIHPTNTTMALDTSECPVDMKVWPEFHNGVAAGLRLPLQLDGGESVTKITRTWIVYNRPSANNQENSQNNSNTNESSTQDQSHAHGGLLMALGMRGHLTALEMTDIFDYLTHGSVTTTVGCLLGMAAK